MEEQKEGNMKSITLMIIMTVIMTGCTYTITQVHTEGQASDVVDETDSVTPSTSLTVPVSAIPK